MLSKFKSEITAEETESVGNALEFTIENVRELWKQHWKTMESKSMQVLFSSAKVAIDDAGEQPKIVITCSGARAKDAILRDHMLKQNMIKQFQRKDMLFELIVDEAQVEKPAPKKVLPQSDRDKYVHFLQLNPILKDFQKRFGLLPPKNSH